MEQAMNAFTSERQGARIWIRIIIAVVLGEGIWSLIVSVANNLIVPWLGDVMGPSAGLPTSFTQRPYNYPDLFVSILELCLAGLVAAMLNYFFQRQRVARVKPAGAAPNVPVRPVKNVAQGPAAGAITHAMPPDSPTAPMTRPNPVTQPLPVTGAPAAPAPMVARAPVAGSVAVAPPAPTIANSVATKPLPPAPKAEPPKPKRPKEVYYNIVGEPIPSDED